MNIRKGILNPDANVVEENGISHKLHEILSDGSLLFSKIPSRSLVILLCQNNYESVFFYLNSINNGVIPILIDAESDISLINHLVSEYKPDFIFAPADKISSYQSYTIDLNFKKFNLLKRDIPFKMEIYDNLALLLSTSGTTGSPKLVRLSYDNINSNASSISDYLNLNYTEIAISNLPMNYSFGLSIINSHLFVGASVVLTTESITQRRFWELFRKFNVTSFSGVPYTLEILKKFKLLNVDLPSLRKITQAGGKLSNDLIEYFSLFSRQREIDFFVMYGQTEGTARLSYLSPNCTLEKLGSIGKPIPDGKFELEDGNGQVITEPNIPGQLVYYGLNVMLGYSENISDLMRGDENKGKLNTGDIAIFDKDGFYYIVGRIKRFIKIFGNRVNLDEVESLLLNLGIKALCNGIDNSLYVYILDEKNESLVKDFITKTLRIHFSVCKIILIDSIPLSNSGKVQYSKLPL